jgi:predicted nucleic acid-binding protein
MFLADTNLLSEPRQKTPNASVLEWLKIHEAELFISAISIAEIQFGIAQLPDGAKRRALQNWFETLREQFRDSILDFDEAVAIRWGNLNAELERKGRIIPLEDSYLAATALEHNLCIATRNEKDFNGIGVQSVNPWKVVK